MRAIAVSAALLLSGCTIGPNAVFPTSPERSEVLAGEVIRLLFASAAPLSPHSLLHKS
jgi:hypothetical protein